MAGKLKNRLMILMIEKERQLGRRLTQLEVANEIGVTSQLMGRWMRNEVDRFDGPVIEKFCDYFQCEVGDLLYIDRES
jgi:DNA-binding Xre family transcriptional regulator